MEATFDDTVAPVARRTTAAAHVRYRWQMGTEARGIVLVSSFLLVFGLATLYSASAIEAMNVLGDGSYYLVRQLQGVLAGMVVFAIAAKVDAQKLEKLAWPIMILAIVTMALVLLPGMSKLHGSRRFLFGGSVQPSEFAKLAVVIWVPMLIVKKGAALRRFSKGLAPFLVVIGLLNLLAVMEPDLSIALLYTLLMAILLFVGGARLGHFIFLGALSVPVLWANVEKLEYVLNRLIAFFDPASLASISYQQKQSLIGIGSGGLTGRGFGEGMQQFGFLPFPYSDFIGSIIGEEWGFVGLAAVTIAFAVYGLLGFRIARNARTPFLQLVAVGLTFTTVLTAYLHLGVVVGLLPTTGLTLPFMSWGRSNLVLTILSTGILVNIGSNRERVVGANATDPVSVAAG